ncbi:MAG: SH3 domain-containing protein [Clostridia bacterium]|nr:SH3 domain-containing protein [Clostridia bacterium]
MKRRIIGLLALWMLLLCAHASAEWATVCNAKPTDRLHLRAEASSSAISYGKYYNGTQVQILSGPKNGWYRVRVGTGNGVCEIEGYMMAKYLAVGNAAVQDARPRVTLSSSSGSVLLRDFHTGSCVGKVQSGTQVTVLGVGTKYLHVLTDSGECGMAPVDCTSPHLEF